MGHQEFTIVLSVRCSSHIYSEWVTNHEACARATEPKNGGCDLLRPDRVIRKEMVGEKFIAFCANPLLVGTTSSVARFRCAIAVHEK